MISISTPGSQIFPGNAAFSVGLARLLNEVRIDETPRCVEEELTTLDSKSGWQRYVKDSAVAENFTHMT